MSDPTDEALATIASDLDYPRTLRGPEEPATTSLPIAPVGGDGYTKIGPGPIAAIRFRWTVRRGENDAYFVDEMVGENPAPIAIGPMSADEAIRLVDDRESEARARFEQIRREMITR